MKIEKTFIKDVFIINPTVFNDKRGYFMESYSYKQLQELIKVDFIQDNESMSGKGVLRGLHFQNPPYSQAKLVRVIKGAVLDVVVDLRKESLTYGKHFAVKLSAKNKKQLFIPKGFAHGFLTLKKNTIFSYKCSNYYYPESEECIYCFDKDLAIDWNIKEPLLSEKDKKGISFNSYKSKF